MAKLKLAALVAATAIEPGFIYASIKDAADLVASGDAEQSTAPNPVKATEFATRASEAGKAKQAAIDAAAQAPAPAFSFITSPAIERGGRRGGGRKHKYPFADFPAPVTGADGKMITAKIFVPVSAAMPDPVKSLSSTVSQASRDYANVTGTKPAKGKNGLPTTRNIYTFERKFAVSPATENGVKGAYIERII